MITRDVFKNHTVPGAVEPLTLDDIADIVADFDLPESEVSH